MSDLEGKIRATLESAQDAHELSLAYPNPYAGIPSPLTKALIQAEIWLKRALAETVAVDIDEGRGGMRKVSTATAQYGPEETRE